MWCSFAEHNLIAHFLYNRSKSFNLLLLRDGRFELDDRALVLYELGLLFRDLAVFF